MREVDREENEPDLEEEPRQEEEEPRQEERAEGPRRSERIAARETQYQRCGCGGASDASVDSD